MDIPTILAALTGNSVTSEEVRTMLMHGLSLAPLLPAMALAIVAASGGGHRGMPAGRSRMVPQTEPVNAPVMRRSDRTATTAE